MTAVLATILFLAAAWLAIVALAASLEPRLDRIVAALRGQPSPVAPAIAVRVSARYPARRAERVRVRPALRAAA